MRIALLLAILCLFCEAFADDEVRSSWVTSKVSGAPTPPKPYVAEKVWPDLTFDRVTDIARLPSRELMFLTEQRGKIWILPGDLNGDTPEPRVFADLGEGLEKMESSFSIAFHPAFEKNREVYVFYRIDVRGNPEGTRISRFRAFPDRLELDLSTEEIVIVFDSGGHNGGHLGFGPDGMLYILTGDAEVPNPPDPLNTGQDVSDLLSSVLRLDVDGREEGKNYAIPEDNPFLDVENARPEIWAYGFRNPWKLSFHPTTGDLWVGDVGWELWEMLYRVERGSNFGWSIVEGPQPIKVDQDMGPSTITAATVFHSHTEMASITGGYVCESDRLPELKDRYLYGDYETGQLWGLTLDGSEVVKKEFLADTRLKIVTFGQASDGEVVFMDWPDQQHLYRLAPNTEKDRSADFPRQLSGTGVFSDLEKEIPEAGVYPFQINGEMWHDGAEADRWIAIPDTGTIATKRGVFADIPEGTVLVKTIRRDGKRIETQISHFENLAWQGYSYRWREDQTDADLVAAEGVTENVGGKPWTFHSRAECVRCHNVGSDYRLSFHAGQLDRDGQLERFQKLGLINDLFVAKTEKEKTAQYDDATASPELRARTWLSANCAHCHRYRGGGSVAISMDLATPIGKMDVVGVEPIKGGFGLDHPLLIAPGEPENSVIYYRSATTGIGHMPMIGARSVDPKGEALLYEWIASMKEKKSDADGKASVETLSEALTAIHRIRSGEIVGEERSRLIGEALRSPNPMIAGLVADVPPEP